MRTTFGINLILLALVLSSCGGESSNFHNSNVSVSNSNSGRSNSKVLLSDPFDPKSADQLGRNIDDELNIWCHSANHEFEGCEQHNGSTHLDHLWAATGRDPSEFDGEGTQKLFGTIHDAEYFTKCQSDGFFSLTRDELKSGGAVQTTDDLYLELYYCDPAHR